MKIHYEPHPVSPERKAELKAQGVCIVDARFAPKEAQPVEAKPEVIPTRESIATMPKAEVVEWLDAHGVEGAKGKVADLRKTLTEIMFVGEE